MAIAAAAEALVLNHVGLMVPDMAAGIAWYEDKFGARVLDRWDNPEAGMEWAHLGIGDFIVELVKMPNLSPAPGRTSSYHHIAISVPDCDATVAELADKGVEVFRAPSDFERHAIRWAFVKDHLGNVIEIISPLSVRAGAATT